MTSEDAATKASRSPVRKTPLTATDRMAEIDLPHLVTDAVPRVDQGGYSIPRKVGEE